jgi:hypothetical protein
MADDIGTYRETMVPGSVFYVVQKGTPSNGTPGTILIGVADPALIGKLLQVYRETVAAQSELIISAA